MLSTIQQIIFEIIHLFIQMAPYLLFGFIVSGFLYVLIPRSLITKHLKPNKISSIFKAAVMGVPLPLCSCGVIPVAAHLRKQGASKSATVSFLASTPSTGADSILATYSLMGPVYTIFRPIDALFSGLLAGFLVKLFDKDSEEASQPKQPQPAAMANSATFSAAPKVSMLSKQPSAAIMTGVKLTAQPATAAVSCCSSAPAPMVEKRSSCCSSEPVVEKKSSCCSSEPVVEKKSSCCSSEPVVEQKSSCCSSEPVVEEKSSCCSSGPVVEKKSSCCSSEPVVEETSPCCSTEKSAATSSSCCSGLAETADERPMAAKIKSAVHYGLFELVDDTKKWIIIGIVIGGLLSWGIPAELADYWITYPALSYLSMLLIGLPMYVCATASIPIATAMLMNGLSPGAALVFLAVGPATNTATMAFLSSSMGKKNMFIYVFSISFSAILLGLVIDIFFGEALKTYFQTSAQMSHVGMLDYIMSVLLAGLIMFQYMKNIKIFKK